MRSAIRIIFNYIRNEHPLGKCIFEEEVQLLVMQLSSRLGLSYHQLDFTPESLKQLENLLLEYSITNSIQEFSDDEIIRFIREIGAYIGKVFVLHAYGKWEPIGSLWSTNIIFEDNVIIVKNGCRRNVPSIAISLGGLGATTWDMLSMGMKPELFNEYANAKSKIFKEILI